jgi:hypothetical protein
MILEKISYLATAAGVIFAAWQIWLSRKQAQTAFEDAMAKEYRDLAATIPTKAFLGEDLTDEEIEKGLDEFYHYFDLCNGQIFLRQTGRIGTKTWIFWSDGMHSNMQRPAFKKAWQSISSRANGDFAELRQLMQGYQLDPKSKKWKQLLVKNS